MKTLIAMLLIFRMSNVWAVCPDLSGTFSCETARGTTDLEFKQEVVDGNTVYTIVDAAGEYRLLTDGKENPYAIPENNETGTVRGTCENDNLNSYIKGESNDNKQNVVASWDIHQIFKLEADKSIAITATGNQTINGESKTVQDSYFCKRK